MFRQSCSRWNAITVVNQRSALNQKVSTLSNGLRVLSIEHGGWSSGVGFFSYNGTAFESQTSRGATAVLEKAVTKPNLNDDEETLAVKIGNLGNSLRFLNHRELTCHLLQCPRHSLDDALGFLNAIALNPVRNEQVFSECKAQAMEHLGLLGRDQTRCCFELIHQAAWAQSPLGRPESASGEELEKLTLSEFRDHHRRMTRPNRSVVVGIGIHDHDSFVQQVTKSVHFHDMPEGSEAVEAATAMPKNLYKGGELHHHCTVAPESVRKFEEKALSHVGLAFKGVTMEDPNYFAYSVMQTLLGGGTSFSSGGPGKGMHTKLFREAINKEPWLHGIECVTAWYRDAGLVGLYGQCPHEHTQNLLKLMVKQAATIPMRVDDNMWQMAKNQLMSQLILLGETRDIMLEEAGKMMLNHDKFLVADDLAKGTEKLSLGDLKDACRAMIQDQPPTFVVYGNTDKLPDVSVLEDRLRSTHKKASE